MWGLLRNCFRVSLGASEVLGGTRGRLVSGGGQGFPTRSPNNPHTRATDRLAASRQDVWGCSGVRDRCGGCLGTVSGSVWVPRRSLGVPTGYSANEGLWSKRVSVGDSHGQDVAQAEMALYDW